MARSYNELVESVVRRAMHLQTKTCRELRLMHPDKSPQVRLKNKADLIIDIVFEEFALDEGKELGDGT